MPSFFINTGTTTNKHFLIDFAPAPKFQRICVVDTCLRAWVLSTLPLLLRHNNIIMICWVFIYPVGLVWYRYIHQVVEVTLHNYSLFTTHIQRHIRTSTVTSSSSSISYYYQIYTDEFINITFSFESRT